MCNWGNGYTDKSINLENLNEQILIKSGIYSITIIGQQISISVLTVRDLPLHDKA